jgi:hypothetical protein
MSSLATPGMPAASQLIATSHQGCTQHSSSCNSCKQHYFRTSTTQDDGPPPRLHAQDGVQHPLVRLRMGLLAASCGLSRALSDRMLWHISTQQTRTSTSTYTRPAMCGHCGASHARTKALPPPVTTQDIYHKTAPRQDHLTTRLGPCSRHYPNNKHVPAEP